MTSKLEVNVTQTGVVACISCNELDCVNDTNRVVISGEFLLQSSITLSLYITVDVQNSALLNIISILSLQTWVDSSV